MTQLYTIRRRSFTKAVKKFLPARLRSTRAMMWTVMFCRTLKAMGESSQTCVPKKITGKFTILPFFLGGESAEHAPLVGGSCPLTAAMPVSVTSSVDNSGHFLSMMIVQGTLEVLKDIKISTDNYRLGHVNAFCKLVLIYFFTDCIHGEFGIAFT